MSIRSAPPNPALPSDRFAREIKPILTHSYNARAFLVPTTLPRTGARTLVLERALVGVGALVLVAGVLLASVTRRNAV